MSGETAQLKRLTDEQVSARLKAYNPGGSLERDIRYLWENAGEIIDDALTIDCVDGAIRPLLVQRAGRAPMAPGELLRGFPIPKGTILK